MVGPVIACYVLLMNTAPDPFRGNHTRSSISRATNGDFERRNVEKAFCSRCARSTPATGNVPARTPPVGSVRLGISRHGHILTGEGNSEEGSLAECR